MEEIKTKNRTNRFKYKYYYDYSLLAMIILLSVFGLIMLYSISAYTGIIENTDSMNFFLPQLKHSILGFVIMLIVSKIPYQIYGKLSPLMYGGSLFLMALVLTNLGDENNGANRWIQIGPIGFQPSETAKLAVILFLSYIICKNLKYIDKKENWISARIERLIYPGKNRIKNEQIIREYRENWFSILGYGAIASLAVWLWTDNLSTAIIVAGIALGIVALVSKKGVVCIGIMLCAILGVIFIIFIGGDDLLIGVIGKFRVQRILVWMDPESYASEGGYQVLQGLYALGTGGWFGKGLGNGTQKLTAIPEVQNDYIIAAIIEELGIFGAGLVFLLFGLLLYRLFFIAQNAPNLYGSLIVSGIFIHIALQVALNIGVVTAILPNTGVVLPFFSYGGTAALFVFVELGIALQVSSRIKIAQE